MRYFRRINYKLRVGTLKVGSSAAVKPVSTELTFMSLQAFKRHWSILIVLIVPGVIRVRQGLLGGSVRNQS